ncbi:MAG: exonuclease SbcCD subunit D C-terminal domain-containing protein [Magnetococcales bacterium]|nr:exonuclease SbcCD subunit D C-terminal domain-containing protein [Magnetococcales bacterium]
MRMLHTSDWHLGRLLYTRKRHAEFGQFLDWLVGVIAQQNIDAVLVAGDIFDTAVPSHEAQRLYYHFLYQVARSGCRHLVITAGNHDSPYLLEAPRELLRCLDVHVIGAITEHPENEVLLLRDTAGRVELIVCAVPYLRDRDIRVVEAGETPEEKQRYLVEGIRSHYQSIYQVAESKRDEVGQTVPIVVMGHLFTVGGQTQEGDGVRELYVGSLVHVATSLFPAGIDYLALGHLHLPQRVGESATKRYSGAPLAMSFAEAKQQKTICLVEFDSRTGVVETRVETIAVPHFQYLEQIRGDWDTIVARLTWLRSENVAAWLEIIYEGETLIADLRDQLEQKTAGSDLAILRIKNNRVTSQQLNSSDEQESLDDLGHEEVFNRCLEAHQVAAEQRPDLLAAYRDIDILVHEGV